MVARFVDIPVFRIYQPLGTPLRGRVFKGRTVDRELVWFHELGFSYICGEERVNNVEEKSIVH